MSMSRGGAIVCGTDFSPLAREAARVSARLAERWQAELHLIHVAEHPRPSAQDALRKEACELAGRPPRLEVLEGLPDEVLARRASELKARLLTVGSLGRRSLSDFLLGSTADRLVRTASTPCLVVRQPERFLPWLEGARPLKVMVGVCQDHTARPALGFLRELAGVAPIERLAVQVSGGPNLSLDWIEQETDRLRELTGWKRQECHVEIAMWPIEQHLLERAHERQIDLLVLGTHHRTGLERLWKGSVSMSVVHRADISVACVPAMAAPRLVARG